MQRAEIRVIEDQQVSTTEVDINNSEAAALLAKYGYNVPVNNSPVKAYNPDSNLTAEQLFQKQFQEEQERKKRIIQKRSGPTPYGFDSNNINYSESKYASIEGENFGIQVQIVSDMPINGRRY
jgi:hypothetical protein